MSFDQILQTLQEHPYLGVIAVFLLCGLGLPLPEEIVLLAAGFVCAKFPDKAHLVPMMGWCAGAIAVGDAIPFLLGRIFGVRLLKLRWLRYFITTQRLATFDHWFRKRGDLVIVISRFLAGLRVVAFFTAGAMKMRWLRFLFLDGLGIVLMVPLLTWLGYRSASFIDEMITTVQKVEKGLLWGAVATAILLAVWLWWWRRRRQAKQRGKLTETFVQPKKPVPGSKSPEGLDDADDSPAEAPEPDESTTPQEDEPDGGPPDKGAAPPDEK